MLLPWTQPHVACLALSVAAGFGVGCAMVDMVCVPACDHTTATCTRVTTLGGRQRGLPQPPRSQLNHHGDSYPDTFMRPMFPMG